MPPFVQIDFDALLQPEPTLVLAALLRTNQDAGSRHRPYWPWRELVAYFKNNIFLIFRKLPDFIRYR